MRAFVNLVSGNDWGRPQPKLTPDHAEQYDMLWRVLQKKKLACVRASNQWFSRGSFKRYWLLKRPGEWIKVNRPLKPLLAYDRMRRFDSKTGDFDEKPYIIKRALARYVPVYNVPDFTELLDNKLYQAVIFDDVMPHTRVLMRGDVVRNPKGENIVIKSVGGSGGEFVAITRQKRYPIDSLKIQQDFIKADPKDIRDYRVGIIGEKVQYVYQRVAAQGSLYTNVHQGATMEFVKLSDVKHITERAEYLLKRLRMFRKKVLSLDFMVDVRDDVAYLVESNSYPGTANFGAERLERYLSNLVDHLLD